MKKITQTDIKNIVKESIKRIVNEGCPSLNYGEKSSYGHGEINEMSRINVNEPQGSIFPFSDFDVHIWSNDHEPAHFHIIADDWNVEFYIKNGELYKINKSGKNQKIFSYICKNVPKWLAQPCAALPTITNHENAQLQWLQLHASK